MESLEMVELKKKINNIINFIIDKNDVVFIDYPAYHNVGDLLIFQGTLQFFKENSINIKAYRSAQNYHIDDLLKFITPHTTIICQGGGNFGDIYHAHQHVRELVVSQFPGNRIIVLPQTAHYSNEHRLNESQALFEKHPDLYLFARDEKTFDLFKKFTKNAFLSPDMAHALYRQVKKNSQTNGRTLYFLRIDCEVNESQNSLKIPDGVTTEDWEDFVTLRDRMFRKLIGYMLKLSIRFKSGFLKDITAYFWRKHCSSLVSRSFLYFSSFDKIITSRMHGHILACLVDVPNIVIDNSYGKNSGYYKQWTSRVASASLFDDKKARE